MELNLSESFTICNIKQAVDLGTTLSQSWFRGHSKLVNELVPKVFRPNLTGLNVWGFSELAFIEEFKRISPSVLSDLPKFDDHQKWLFLMQHYGSPTRLLDWTQSILVALFFVVCDDSKEDGELWAMYPKSLNNHSKIFGIPTLNNNPTLEYLFAEPQYNNTKILLENYQLAETPRYPVAFSPSKMFPRMNYQQSNFTIHPNNNNDQTIPSLLTNEKDLVKYIIPKDCKNKLYFDLDSLGIKYHTLFPDLDNLSKYILKTYCSKVAYSPPEPPKFDKM